MIRDIALNQGAWLVNNVVDKQRHGGVCHAMTTEWVFDKLQNRNWVVHESYWRGVSHQRAYAIYWQDALRGLWGGAHYNQYLQIALRPTEKFISDPARRQGRDFHVDHVFNLNQLSPHIIGLSAGSGLVIVMFGVDGNDNWGHTVAVVRQANDDYLFLDINQGQYSWAGGTSGGVAGREVEKSLNRLYGNDGIRDVYLYRVG